MDTQVLRTIRVTMTPAKARELASHLIERANAVELMNASRNTRSSYGHVSIGVTQPDTNGDPVRVRLGCVIRED